MNNGECEDESNGAYVCDHCGGSASAQPTACPAGYAADVKPDFKGGPTISQEQLEKMGYTCQFDVNSIDESTCTKSGAPVFHCASLMCTRRDLPGK